MSKTSSAVVCETNQILGKNQENVYFHSLYRVPEEFGSSYIRSAKSTAPIQICAVFSAQGEDTLAAMTLQAVLAKMQEITATTQQMSVLDYESFTTKVVNVLNNTVCNESIKHNGANIRVSMSMIIIEGDTLRVLNIGNTHIWMFRQGKLISLTENQTVAHRYVQMGAIPKDAEYTHEGRNELTQYLGRFAQDGEVLPDKKVHLKLMDGDELVMIGTGLDQDVPIQKLGVVIARPTQPETKASELISCAMQQGVKAGLTALVVRIESTLLLPGDAKIEEAAVTNDLSAASKPIVAAAPVAPAVPVAPVQQPASADNAPTIQSDELRYRMNQQFQEPPIPAFGDEEEDDFDDEDFETPARSRSSEKKKKEKKGSALKNILIGLLIFLICGVVGYAGMYVLFNIAHWNGDLKPIETSEQSFEELDQVMYALYDDTALYVEESLDSQTIDTLARGEAITLLASNGSFAKIRKENGLMGYVPLDMISEEDPTIGEKSETEFIDPTPIPTTPTEITKATSQKQETEPTSAPETSESTSEITPPGSSSEATSAPQSSSEATSESSESSSETSPSESSSEQTSSESAEPSSSEETSSETEAPSSETEAPSDPA